MYISPNINRILAPDTKGSICDVKRVDKGQWLVNSEVLYQIEERNSQWYLTMIYVDIKNPLHFLCRKIDQYSSLKRAETFAQILQRGIRKDARGTLKTNKDAINICTN